MHSELRLVQGVQIAPGDTQSMDGYRAIVDLLSGATEGFALEPDTGAWNPGIAQDKSGLWYETPFTDGRTLYAGAEQNVTEVMRLVLTAPDQKRIGYWLALLGKMRGDCLRFWQGDALQIDPVFLWWKATCAPGAQYALIYQFDYVVGIPTTNDAGQVVRDITLTIEREPFWRGIPPGSNPTLWQLGVLGQQPGLNYTYTSGELRLAPASGAPIEISVVTGSVANRVEFNNSPFQYFAQNHVVIPAGSIPGDAPALLHTTVDVDLNNSESAISKRLMIAHRTGQVVQRNKTNDDNALFVNCLPAIQSTDATGTPATIVIANDTGACLGYTTRAAPSFATAKRIEITPTATMAVALNFVGAQLSMHVQRGRYAIFARCRQDSGSAGDCTMQLRLDSGSNQAAITPVRTVPLQAGTGNTTRWPLMYLGTLKFPNDRPTQQSLGDTYGGTGPNNANNSTLSLTLLTRRSTGASKIYVADLVFMPLDEGFIDIRPIAANNNDIFIYDNTGYGTHGNTDSVGLLYGTENLITPCEVQGSDITLKPGADNYLFFLYRSNADESNVREDLTAWINIVPRWRYIRDV